MTRIDAELLIIWQTGCMCVCVKYLVSFKFECKQKIADSLLSMFIVEWLKYFRPNLLWIRTSPFCHGTTSWRGPSSSCLTRWCGCCHLSRCWPESCRHRRPCCSCRRTSRARTSGSWRWRSGRRSRGDVPAFRAGKKLRIVYIYEFQNFPRRLWKWIPTKTNQLSHLNLKMKIFRKKLFKLASNTNKVTLNWKKIRSSILIKKIITSLLSRKNIFCDFFDCTVIWLDIFEANVLSVKNI